jgi:hypothetical protein
MSSRGEKFLCLLFLLGHCLRIFNSHASKEACVAFTHMIWDDRALIGHYGSEKVDLEFLEVSKEGVASTTLGLEVRPWFVNLGDISGKGFGLGNTSQKSSTS